MSKNINSKIRQRLTAHKHKHRTQPPNNQEGHDGDLLFATDNGVNKLYGKINKEWYAFGNGQKIGYRGRSDLNQGAGDQLVSNIDIKKQIKLHKIPVVSTDTDKFLMAENGIIKSVTGANLLTYSGAQAALTFGIASTNAVKIDAADVADDDYARFTANGLEGRTLAEIKSDIGTGNSALVPAAGSSGHFLANDGVFRQITYANISGTPAIPTNFVTNDASDSMLGGLTSVSNMAGTTTNTDSSFTADLNQGGNTAGGQTRTAIGFKADYDYTGTNSTGAITTFEGLKIEANTPSCNTSTINNSGVVSVLTGDNSGSGTVRQTGVDLTITGGDTANQTGLLLNTDDGSTDIKIVSSANTDDFFAIQTFADGETTISTTEDGGGQTAHLTLDVDGDIILDADGGNVFIKDNGSTLIQLASNAVVVGEVVYGNNLVQYDGDDLLSFATEELTITNYLKIGETANANADTAGKGQLWVKNDSPNNLYFTDDTGQDVQITNNGSLAASGGTQCWTKSCGGLISNNSSTTNYYTQNYPGYFFWSNVDSSPDSVSYLDSYAYAYKAPKDGTLTKICFTGRCTRTDSFKVYVYKTSMANGDTSSSATLIGESSSIVPPATNQVTKSTTTISSSNSFSAGDELFIWIKKNLSTGGMTFYFSVTIEGEYS